MIQRNSLSHYSPQPLRTIKLAQLAGNWKRRRSFVVGQCDCNLSDIVVADWLECNPTDCLQCSSIDSLEFIVAEWLECKFIGIAQGGLVNYTHQVGWMNLLDGW